LFKDFLKENDLVTVILEQLDYLCKLHDRNSPYSYAAYSVSQLDHPVSSIKNKLQDLKGVGPTTEKIILEILDTGTSSYYEKLLY
jgi:DNA polymerase/3'-5' exonuclease PolX